MRSKILAGALEFGWFVSFVVGLMHLSMAWGEPLEEGETYEAQHLYYQAVKEYEKIDNPELREEKLNHLWNGWNGLDGQIIRSQENLAKNPSSAEAHYQLGDKYYQKGMALINYQRQNLRNYPEAFIESEKTFFLNAAASEGTEALRLNEKYPEARLLLGKVYLAQGKKPEAIQEINQAVALDPNYKESYWTLAQIYLADKTYDQAEANLIKYINLSPDDATAHALLGNVYLERKNFEKAISELDKALKANPADAEAVAALARAYNIYGDHLFQEGKYDQALVAFQKAFQLKSLKEYYDDLQTAQRKQEEVRLTRLSQKETTSKKSKQIQKPKQKKKRGGTHAPKVQTSANKKKEKPRSAQSAATPPSPSTGLATSSQASSPPKAEKPGKPMQSGGQPPSEQSLPPTPTPTEQPKSEPPASPPQPPQGEPKGEPKK